MRCDEARATLWPPEQPRLCASDVVAAREHVDGCAACREHFAQDRLLLDSFHRLGEVRAPRRVRERVFDTLSRERWERQRPHGREGIPTSRRAGVVLTLMAAGVAGLAMVWQGLGVAVPDREPGAVFVEDYLRRAVGQDHIVSTDAEEVRRFLVRELGMELGPLQTAGLRIERAEICLLEGRRGAMIVYKKGGASVSHYLVPREGTVARAPALMAGTPSGGGEGMPVVTWSTPSLEQALVGELGAAQLLELARGG